MSNDLTWFKSSYSDGQGGNCVEVALDWHKSTYSDDQGSNCVEVAACPHTVHVRDTKLGAAGPRFSVPADAWGVFLGGVATRSGD
ncbi:DUF397 domain-containing protein [Streptomyces antarcticus]|uniref:DUF397 domain-containing protein n=1 Tax=Streptomyces antarcticus TaxID=2996458 RepID=UPI00226E67D5|nr:MULTISPECIES: DUF397 domain-containing protein [unclassified Streptomyces]MCY0940720.1 DUF397 domain-containing protein [Streptomyces sp. H34-AA3]MCY0948600.1 DUF397 domain-containing protein [Streptomyces sp. H27-S2]MCZ4082013.1 DUF397 domain-containing protein [Streptomyces sp. H34-S5]